MLKNYTLSTQNKAFVCGGTPCPVHCWINKGAIGAAAPNPYLNIETAQCRIIHGCNECDAHGPRGVLGLLCSDPQCTHRWAVPVTLWLLSHLLLSTLWVPLPPSLSALSGAPDQCAQCCRQKVGVEAELPLTCVGEMQAHCLSSDSCSRVASCRSLFCGTCGRR